MIRKFNGNNYMKGRISWQLEKYVDNGAIKFEDGAKRNTCIIIVDESQMDTRSIRYMYNKLIPIGREIKGA